MDAPFALAAALLMAAGIAPATAQTKLKWAHVYEIAEPYHTEALWAADEIKKRTNGKYEIQVFPASQLGNENQINEGLGLDVASAVLCARPFRYGASGLPISPTPCSPSRSPRRAPEPGARASPPRVTERERSS